MMYATLILILPISTVLGQSQLSTMYDDVEKCTTIPFLSTWFNTFPSFDDKGLNTPSIDESSRKPPICENITCTSGTNVQCLEKAIQSPSQPQIVSIFSSIFKGTPFVNAFVYSDPKCSNLVLAYAFTADGNCHSSGYTSFQIISSPSSSQHISFAQYLSRDCSGDALGTMNSTSSFSFPNSIFSDGAACIHNGGQYFVGKYSAIESSSRQSGANRLELLMSTTTILTIIFFALG